MNRMSGEPHHRKLTLLCSRDEGILQVLSRFHTDPHTIQQFDYPRQMRPNQRRSRDVSLFSGHLEAAKTAVVEEL